jgi:hypothetical protein
MDDSGSRHPNRDGKKSINNRDWFALVGILIKQSDRAKLRTACESFSKKWNIDYPLHSNEIRRKSDYFSWLGKNEEKAKIFHSELNDLLCNLPVLGFSTVINRQAYYERYEEIYAHDTWLMSKSAYSILIERVVKYVTKSGGNLRIRFEDSGKKENQNIISYSKTLKTVGNIFDNNRSSKYEGLTHENYKNVILGDPEKLTKSSIEMQIADLFLYPMVVSAYDKNYLAYRELLNSGRLIDSHLSEDERHSLGIKYFCF